MHLAASHEATGALAAAKQFGKCFAPQWGSAATQDPAVRHEPRNLASAPPRTSSKKSFDVVHHYLRIIRLHEHRAILA